jgi:hypothetical protein
MEQAMKLSSARGLLGKATACALMLVMFQPLHALAEAPTVGLGTQTQILPADSAFRLVGFATLEVNRGGKWTTPEGSIVYVGEELRFRVNVNRPADLSLWYGDAVGATKLWPKTGTFAAVPGQYYFVPAQEAVAFDAVAAAERLSIRAQRNRLVDVRTKGVDVIGTSPRGGYFWSEPEGTSASLDVIVRVAKRP